MLTIVFHPAENRASLNVDYNVIALKEWVLALFLPEAPTEMLAILDQAAKDVVLGLFPQYERISKEIHVRITDLPLMEDIRSLRWVARGGAVDVAMEAVDMFPFNVSASFRLQGTPNPDPIPGHCHESGRLSDCGF